MSPMIDSVYASNKMTKSESIVLKVQMNCNCCARKVKKAIGEVEGVESIVVDMKHKKVTVTGSFDSSKVVKQVARKTGKNVQLAGTKEHHTKAVPEKSTKIFPESTVFPAEDAFLFSEENPTACSIM